jgi:lysozyme family protein
MTFATAWDALLDIERGYVNNPRDRGGPTNFGVTERVARAHGYEGDMRDLPIAAARRIAKLEYWDPLRLDAIDLKAPALASELLDIRYNMWRDAAGMFLQRALNALQTTTLTLDGRVGPKTLSALYGYLQRRGRDGETVLLRMLNAQQCVDYLRQCEDDAIKRDFIYGWVLKRVKV